jgi:NADPH-dependent curcumin reductase CurA
MYNLEKPDIGPRIWRTLIVKNARAEGFMVLIDYIERFAEGRKQMLEWVLDGKIKSKVTVVNGLENAPQAFLDLFSGANTGKMLVKVAKEIADS